VAVLCGDKQFGRPAATAAALTALTASTAPTAIRNYERENDASTTPTANNNYERGKRNQENHNNTGRENNIYVHNAAK
jgi:hypothetical protein